MNDIAKQLARLHELEGAEFVVQLKSITAHEGFHPLPDNPCILTMGGEKSEDYDNQLDAARKAVACGYRVFILPNPKGIRTADFIFERHGIFKMYDLKTIHGKTSVLNRLMESIDQCNHVLINMKTRYNSGRLSVDIRNFFVLNSKACEVVIFKGGQIFSITRINALEKGFLRAFRKKYGKN